MKPGEELAGRYRLEQRLGRGGMGEVWRALDVRLDRQVAVKALLVNWTGEQADQALARFRREGKAAARLNHPRIATVHDIADDQGRPFLILELLAGPDLAALLSDLPGGLPIGMVLEYGAQAAEGLSAAHSAGVIHRDIKPSNLMLDGNGALKICDFGIARLAGATAGLSAPGTLLGTFAYMPPEQLLGRPVTGAADVYALGASLFQLLTGRPLFPADDLGAIMGQHLHTPPPPPSSVRPTIPHALDAYLITLLAKDPSSRPAAHVIPADLRALATHLIRPRSSPYARRDYSNDGPPLAVARGLTKAAKAIHMRDPAEAEDLLADAEGMIDNPKRYGYLTMMLNPVEQLSVLVEIAKVAAEWNPVQADAVIDRAMRLVALIIHHQDSHNWVGTLSMFVGMVARRDLARAEALLAAVERNARDITDLRRRGEALAAISKICIEQLVP